MTFDDRGKGAQPPADIWKIQLDLLSNQNSFNVFNIPRPASNALMNYKVLCTDNTNGSKSRKGNLRRPAHGFFLVAWNAERGVDRNSVGCGNQKNPMLFGESKCICHPWAETLQHLPQKILFALPRHHDHNIYVLGRSWLSSVLEGAPAENSIRYFLVVEKYCNFKRRFEDAHSGCFRFRRE